MTEIFSQNDVSRILKRAADISLEKLALSTRLENFINSHGIPNGITPEYLIGPIISVTAMLLHQTSIDIFNHKEGIAINAALLGQSETENEASHDLFRDGIMELERFLKIPTEKSWLCSVNEADSLIDALLDNPAIINLGPSLPDFLTTPIINNISTHYESNVYNSLFSAKKIIDKQNRLKKIRVQGPRFHMAIHPNPFEIVNLLKSERAKQTSGYINTFFLYAPRSSFIGATSIINAPSIKISIANFIYYLWSVHYKTERVYTFSEDALQIIKLEYDNLKFKTRIAHESDQHFLTSILSKAFTKLIRLCLILHVIDVTLEALANVSDADIDKITPEFSKQCYEIQQKSSEKNMTIQLTTTLRASKLLAYFNMQHIVLSDFEIDSYSNSQETIHNLIDSFAESSHSSTCERARKRSRCETQQF